MSDDHAANEPAAGKSDTPRTAEELRADIETTRAELSQTADALAAKLDVKAQAKEKVHAVGDKVTTTASDVGTKVTEDKQRSAVIAGSAAAVVAFVVVLRVRRRRRPKVKVAKALAKTEKARRKAKKS